MKWKEEQSLGLGTVTATVERRFDRCLGRSVRADALSTCLEVC